MREPGRAASQASETRLACRNDQSVSAERAARPCHEGAALRGESAEYQLSGACGDAGPRSSGRWDSLGFSDSKRNFIRWFSGIFLFALLLLAFWALSWSLLVHSAQAAAKVAEKCRPNIPRSYEVSPQRGFLWHLLIPLIFLLFWVAMFAALACLKE